MGEKNNSKKKNKSKEKMSGTGMDIQTLLEYKNVDIVFEDNKALKGCKFIKADNYNIIVETDKAKLLIPKHSIKYYILEKY